MLTSLEELSDSELRGFCEDFLYREAELLDGLRFQDWLELLSPELKYYAPVRIVADLSAAFSEDSHHLWETFDSLALRVSRLRTGLAWAETPASATCRLIGNVRIERHEDPGRVRVRSSFMLFRGQLSGCEHDLLCGDRKDVLQLHDQRLRLCSREIRFANTVVPVSHLGVFF